MGINMDIIKCEPCNREFQSQEALAMHNSAKHNMPLGNAKQERSNKNVFWVVGILAIIVVYFLVSGRGLTGNAVSEKSSTEDAVQNINLGFNANYYPNTITVELGKPVEITLDSSVRGCFRSFHIRDLGVSYLSSGPSDTIKFIPLKKGTFEFACGMRMATGTIIVA